MDKKQVIEMSPPILSQGGMSDWVDPLLFEGELLLLRGHLADALERFDKAESLAPPAASLFYREALALFEYGCSENHKGALAKACKKFKQTLSLAPAHQEAWHAWGNALVALGDLTGATHFYQEASEKLARAIRLIEEGDCALSADLYWDYGIAWSRIAKHSGEAMDLQCAIQAYQKASALLQTLPVDFWIDFGRAHFDSISKVRDMRSLLKAISCFKFALTQDKDSSLAWKGLADALETLYTQTHDEDHFTQCNDCFSNATRLSPRDTKLWLQWARFLIAGARKNGDVKRLRAALEKCHQAYVRDTHDPLILAIWAEALALLGQLTERLDLLYEAQNKISDALDISEEDPEIWYCWGMCLSSFAVYFADVDYYYQAIEKFQTGLSIDRTIPYLWEAIAAAYAAAGNIENETEALETSLKFFQKALALAPSNSLIIQQAIVLSRIGEMTHQQQWLECAVQQFEIALSAQKNVLYCHPDWLFQYASTLDLLGDFHDSERYYTRAIEIFTHVLMIDPDFPRVHHRLALAYCHMGELLGEVDYFYRSIHHLRLALKQEEEDDQMILDWAIVLINIAQHAPVATDTDQLYRDAEQKMILSAKLGNLHAYYHLSCLYSLLGQYEKSFEFLLKAQEYKTLPTMEELLQDDWLDGLRMTSDFRSFISRFENRPNYEER